jgi:hypothetical protein
MTLECSTLDRQWATQGRRHGTGRVDINDITQLLNTEAEHTHHGFQAHQRRRRSGDDPGIGRTGPGTAAGQKAAGLVETLKGDGPFTVFAPTDAAFARLPAGTVESLLRPENIDQLRAILTYHVVPGKVLAADVVGLESATTVQGQALRIEVNGMAVRIDDAKVIQTDIMASNGVIHVIDSVVLPSADDK